MKKQPLKEKLKAIGGGHLLKEGYAWERKFGEPLPTLTSVQNKHQNKVNEAFEIEDVQHYESDIFDAIAEFKKVFEKSEWKKNRKINSLIKQLFKLETQLGNETGDLE